MCEIELISEMQVIQLDERKRETEKGSEKKTFTENVKFDHQAHPAHARTTKFQWKLQMEQQKKHFTHKHLEFQKYLMYFTTLHRINS